MQADERRYMSYGQLIIIILNFNIYLLIAYNLSELIL